MIEKQFKQQLFPTIMENATGYHTKLEGQLSNRNILREIDVNTLETKKRTDMAAVTKKICTTTIRNYIYINVFNF